jgi:hypothetical protein
MPTRHGQRPCEMKAPKLHVGPAGPARTCHQMLELTCSACAPSAQSASANVAEGGNRGVDAVQQPQQQVHVVVGTSSVNAGTAAHVVPGYPVTRPVTGFPGTRALAQQPQPKGTPTCEYWYCLIKDRAPATMRMHRSFGMSGDMNIGHQASYRSFGGGGGQAGALRQERPNSGPILRVTLQQREHRSSEDAGSPQQLLGPRCVLPGQRLLSHNLRHHLHGQQPQDSWTNLHRPQS